MMQSVPPWLAWALGSALFAALTAVFAKAGVAQVNADLATLIRTGFVFIVLALVVAAAGELQPVKAFPAKTWLFLFLSAMGTGASWFCYFRALKAGEAARVAPIDKLSVVFVAILAALFLGEKLSLRNWLGVTMIGVGAVLVAVRA
jgi:bacterial/archaeal transporter family protein